MKELLRKTGGIVFIVLLSLVSCKDNKGDDGSKLTGKNDKVTGRDGGITLLIENADLIQVDSNPQYNTAEWSFEVKKPGRYDVWLSSITCDTSHLLYADNVTITAGDSRLEKMPVGDEIVTDDKSVRSPWFRADSHMGSVFFSEPGEYQIQVISDRVLPHSSDPAKVDIDKHTLINSLIFKPKVN
ncbi:MAG TPA: hypothetical protein VMV74_01600 [Bacteroidales bacterium]|nr:hypothetical protein [Bacteroidales bacterium]